MHRVILSKGLNSIKLKQYQHGRKTQSKSEKGLISIKTQRTRNRNQRFIRNFSSKQIYYPNGDENGFGFILGIIAGLSGIALSLWVTGRHISFNLILR